MPLALEERACLKPLNAFGVPATAAWLARIRHAEDLRELADDPRLAGLPTLVLGGGTNILFVSDFDGVVIRIEVDGLEAVGETEDAWLYEAGAGVDWHALVSSLLDRGIGGLENLALIPGTAGAAPVQNIGAYGVEIAERLHSVLLWDRATGSARRLSPEQCEFGYRDSVFKGRLAGRGIVLSVTLALPKRWHPVLGYAELERELKGRAVGPPGVRDVFDAICAIRRRKLPDPAVIGNAGSFFKNPVVGRDQRDELIARYPSMVSYGLAGGRFKLAAGWLIEACGLKGVTRGRAGVFERQALVLVNRGGATGREILDLAHEVQARVSEKFGVRLEPEAVIV
jgi:UDP-N-acetylmuramate dehydrogenase